jgi:hypothetical protein
VVKTSHQGTYNRKCYSRLKKEIPQNTQLHQSLVIGAATLCFWHDCEACNFVTRSTVLHELSSHSNQLIKTASLLFSSLPTNFSLLGVSAGLCSGLRLVTLFHVQISRIHFMTFVSIHDSFLPWSGWL